MENIEDIYELSPLQQGMLFHTLYSPESGVYFEQRSCLLQGNLNVTIFQKAWQLVTERHAVLRTGFYWEEVEKSLQVVYKTVELPWIIEDCNSENQEKLEAFLLADRKRGFNLNEAPLMRCALIRVGENAYRFIWSHHHLLMDGWCNGILLKEVLAFYEALLQNKTLTLIPTRPYRDYILWLQEQDLEKAETYWTQCLQGFTEPTKISIKSSKKQEIYQEEKLNLSTSLTTNLQAFAQENRLTLNTIIQGAWAFILSRYGGENDIIFGATVSGRPPTITGVDSIVGLFINTLPVRIKINSDDLVSWLQQLQAQQIEREQYSYSSLIDIQGWSEVPRGIPLFESLVVFENYPISLETILQEWNGILKISDTKGFEQTNYPLTLSVIPSSELSLHISYDIGCFNADTIKQILEHLELILSTIVTNPQSIQDLPSLTPSEEHKLFIEWNNTKQVYSSDKCIHQLFEEQVKKTPDAIAVAFEDKTLTYHQLNQQANQLANYLKNFGVKSDELIGICLKRSLEMIVALLGVLKAGCGYVPLDPNYPKERLDYIIQETQIKVLLTQQDLIQNTYQIPVIFLDQDWKHLSSYSDINLDLSLHSNNLAYIIYTSGSTGKPKGVMIEHRSLVSFTQWAIKHYQLTSNDKILQFATISFDTAAEEIYPCLCSGGTLVLRTDEMLSDLAKFIQKCQDLKLTVLDLPTAYWHQLSGESEKLKLKLPSSVRLIIIGGEKVIQSANNLKNSAQLINTYGPTETTIVATTYTIENNLSEIPIGRAIDNVQTYIVDRNLQLVPIGVAGELLIGGLHLARGYFNRPDLTADKFIPNPFTDSNGERLYKTGDKARYLSDGNIEYLGRLDNQVKIRGFRIELGEIEAILNQHPEIKEAIVLTYDQNLAAYIVTDQALTVSDLRCFLRERLPEYMIPAYFVFLKSFPLTVNGKINRRQLPTPVPSRTDEVTYILPRSPIEEIIAGIWTNILGVETVGVDDNFFELGGHSLLATQVISRLRDAFKLEIPLKDLFNSPTVAGLAQKIEQSQEKEQIAPILPISRQQDLPLSFAQARLWFLAQLEPNNPFYNIAIPIRIQGSLQVDVLEQSFNKILQRHEILRTTFETRDGKPIQVILSEVRFNLDVFESEEPIKELALKEAQHPFNLDQSPLLRIKILRVSETEHILLLTLHHIIADGWSLGILVQELAAFYQGKPLEPLPIQYADFASWQREYLQSTGQDAPWHVSTDYWKEQLHDAPSLLELPSDRPRPAIQSFRGARYKFKLSRQLTDALKTLSQKSGSTLFMVLLATFSTLLHRYTGNSDIVIGSPIANRNRSELEALIGFFVNTLPLRINSAGNPTFEELLQRVRQVTLNAYTYQDLPFERILDYLSIERSLSYSPLFQVMFVLQNTPMEKIEVSGLTWTPLELENSTAKFDLTIILEETAQGLDGVFEYNTDLFEAATIHRMAGCFRTLLSAVVESPELPISELPLLSKAQQKQLLVSRNETQTHYPKDLCIHQVFERQAAKTPDAVAVVYEEQQLTYRELDKKANQLAYILQQQGVTTETLIGLCVERRLDMIVAMLAILKAGGVYVPIDATYPQERINFIVEDTGLELVLTQHEYISLFSGVKCICLDVGIWFPNPSHPTNPNVLISSTPQYDNLAYVMYTSGSTGIPKGVCIPHRGVIRLVKENNYIHFGTDEVFLQAAPTSFDAATFEIWGALLNGAKLVLLPYHQPSLTELGNAILKYQITTLWLTAGLFQLMIDEQLDSLVSIRQLLAGGDVLSRVHVQKFLHRYPNSRMINGYGPTEGTTFTCTADLSVDDDALPIGRPISNTQVYILDSYLQPVPVGVAGELYIGGDGLARGYLNRFDLTAEKFIPNPFSRDVIYHVCTRLYQTGDRVRCLPNGNIEYLGRLDRQVKIRGFRIELGEIEAILNQHPKVKESVVIVQERLIAYVVPSQDLTSSELRGFLSEQLPDYMIPAFFVLLDSLPLTSNGKIDRIALPSPEITISDDVPRTAIESKLAEIWSNLLNLEVGIHDNFFELGGDSILAIQIVARANQAGLQITPKQIFQYQTIAELATIAGTSNIILSEQGLVTGLVPLTPIQHWFFEQNLYNPHHFNQAVLLEVKSELNLSYLQQALEHLFLHHDALRLRFEYQSGEWQQVNSNEIPILDLNISNVDEIESIANQLQDLSGDLVRVAYFGSRLLFVVHHLVIDGISWRILLEDLQTAYQQLERGETVQLPSKTTSFKQWSESLQKYTDSETEREYWHTLLSNPVYPLPVDERGENTIASSDTVTVILDTEQTQALLTEVPQAYNTQINDILLTALALAFKKWTGNSTLLLDLESHGRESIFTEIDVSRTVGWFTSIFPVYLNVEDETLAKAIYTIKEQLRRIPNQGIGYGILNYIKSSDSIRSSNAEVSFNYLGQFDQMLSASPYFNLAQESTGLSSALQNQRRYLLEINGMIRDKQLYLNWTYSKRIHDRTTIENLAQYFLTSLQDLIEHCQLDAGGYTPSDFTLAQLDSEQLDAVMMMVEFEGE
ncbi:non-ribosomal peptide synthetase [Aphanothece hegewaldii CCALA 016]|uniref:Non-ribosomal peptide synthetase n=1 Tax=Aphanothece hegewaldii CCALA 016 TaxID=2107694 RepID=A0A2T1LYH0_9CHRO|nr:non-ribosomal peptide synthetase [Aphanothece hegewaldii]PSF37372.1 non-ribosomal peptide synthetase [Aphanothece hegewaldii CCALA 016]